MKKYIFGIIGGVVLAGIIFVLWPKESGFSGQSLGNTFEVNRTMMNATTTAQFADAVNVADYPNIVL